MKCGAARCLPRILRFWPGARLCGRRGWMACLAVDARPGSRPARLLPCAFALRLPLRPPRSFLLSALAVAKRDGAVQPWWLRSAGCQLLAGRRCSPRGAGASKLLGPPGGQGERFMEYHDRVLKCSECSAEFVFNSRRADVFADKGFKNERSAARVARLNGPRAVVAAVTGSPSARRRRRIARSAGRKPPFPSAPRKAGRCFAGECFQQRRAMGAA